MTHQRFLYSASCRAGGLRERAQGPALAVNNGSAGHAGSVYSLATILWNVPGVGARLLPSRPRPEQSSLLITCRFRAPGRRSF